MPWNFVESSTGAVVVVVLGAVVLGAFAFYAVAASNIAAGYFAENTVGAGVVNTDVAHAFDVPTVAVAFKIPDPRS